MRSVACDWYAPGALGLGGSSFPTLNPPIYMHPKQSFREKWLARLLTWSLIPFSAPLGFLSFWWGLVRQQSDFFAARTGDFVAWVVTGKTKAKRDEAMRKQIEAMREAHAMRMVADDEEADAEPEE